MSAKNLFFSCLAMACLAAVAHGGMIDMPMVTVGDPGNAPDTTVMNDQTSGFGAVAYTYSIGKYDVTQAQYAQFLNAKAATDTYGLYSQSAPTDVNNGIVRSGSPGSYTYTVSAGYANLPTVDVSWYDAIRFVNWLGNGHGNGDTETGTYTITNPNYFPNLGITEWTVTAPSLAQRAAWAAGNQVHWLLPTEDEWYKAAYYVGGGTSAGYWAYPTQSNTLPTSEPPPGGSDSANIFNQYTGYALTQSTISNPSQLYLTDVGAYSDSPSAYGTFDQGGDVAQWNEAAMTPMVTLTGYDRGLRGGSWYPGYSPASTERLGGDADYAGDDTGFRVASIGVVPEPGTAEILLVGTITALVIFLTRFMLARCRSKRAARRVNERFFKSLGKVDGLLSIFSKLRSRLLQHCATLGKRARRRWPVDSHPHFARLPLFEALEQRSLLDGAGLNYPTVQPFHVVIDPATGGAYVGDGVPAGTATPGSAYTPAQIRGAYGISQIAGNGAGQTIAIIDAYDDPDFVSSTSSGFLTSDLHEFDTQFNLPDPPSFEKLDENGGTNCPETISVSNKNTTWASEIALDVEWAHAIAPDANIILFEAVSNSISDLVQAVDTARNTAGVSAVSMSWAR